MKYSQVYLALASPNFTDLVKFYQALLTHKPTAYQPERYAEFRLPGLKLAIFCPRPDQQETFRIVAQGSLSLCIEVDNLEAAIAHLKTLGHPPTGPILSASHGREVYAHDPDGNRLILHEAAD